MMAKSNARDPWVSSLLTEARRDRAFAAGEWVQVRSGGAPMEVLGYEDNGDALCRLGDRTFAMPQLLLRPVGDKPRRRGRKVGISPARRPDCANDIAVTARPDSEEP